MSSPHYSPQEAQDRETFLALLWSLSHPGRWHQLPASAAAAPFVAIGQALLDLETSFYTPDAALAEVLARTGARPLPASEAAYLFFPAFSEADMPAIEAANRGTLLYPDTAALLVLAGQAGDTFQQLWWGPGIDGTTQVGLSAMPAALWELRPRARYPLGWDAYFVDASNAQVLGLPRSTFIDAAQGSV